MRFGCFASLCLWLVLVSLLSGSVVPLAIAGVLYVFLLIHRGMHSDWPLY